MKRANILSVYIGVSPAVFAVFAILITIYPPNPGSKINWIIFFVFLGLTTIGATIWRQIIDQHEQEAAKSLERSFIEAVELLKKTASKLQLDPSTGQSIITADKVSLKYNAALLSYEILNFLFVRNESFPRPSKEDILRGIEGRYFKVQDGHILDTIRMFREKYQTKVTELYKDLKKTNNNFKFNADSYPNNLQAIQQLAEELKYIASNF
jgi:hypothetical protein